MKHEKNSKDGMYAYFTKSAPSLIQSISHNVCLFVCVSVCMFVPCIGWDPAPYGLETSRQRVYH